MDLTSFDPAAQYVAKMVTCKKVQNPGLPPVVVTNFLITCKIARRKRSPPEGDLAKHHFQCDAALVPIHRSTEVLKRLVDLLPGTKRFPWSRLKKKKLLIRFGEPSTPGFHNPIEDILSLDSSVMELPTARKKKQEGYPKVDRKKFTVTWRGLTARFTDCNEFKLLDMLISANGNWITHEEIAEFVIRDTAIDTSNICVALKYRLAKKLRDQGMGDLADAIKPGKRKYRLHL